MGYKSLNLKLRQWDHLITCSEIYFQRGVRGESREERKRKEGKMGGRGGEREEGGGEGRKRKKACKMLEASSGMFMSSWSEYCQGCGCAWYSRKKMSKNRKGKHPNSCLWCLKQHSLCKVVDDWLHTHCLRQRQGEWDPTSTQLVP